MRLPPERLVSTYGVPASTARASGPAAAVAARAASAAAVAATAAARTRARASALAGRRPLEPVPHLEAARLR